LSPELPWRQVLPGLVLCIILVGMVLNAGCATNENQFLDYQPNRDVGVVKLTAAGTPDWSVLVTTGKDTVSRNIIENSDGSYILTADIAERKNSGRLLPRLIKISPNGQILWDDPVGISDCGSYVLIIDSQGSILQIFHQGTTCPILSTEESAQNGSMNYIVHGSIKKTGDGGLLFGGFSKESRLLTKDEFVKGRQTRLNEPKEYAEKMWLPYCQNATPINDEFGYCTTPPIIKATIAKSNPDGSVSWQQDFPNYTSDPASVLVLNGGKGYVARFGNAVLRIAPDGTVLNTTMLSTVPEYSPVPPSRSMNQNYSMLSGTLALLFDENGMITRQEPVPGQTGISTRDGGFLMINAKMMKSSTTYDILTFATKYNTDGSIAWDNHVLSKYAFATPTRVIQTSDGGYVILSLIDNQSARRQ